MIRVGLLGGSFNPAHEGHLAISKVALKKLKLSQVWWLVSPQNPLKNKNEMADFATRLDSAIAVANCPKIKVSGIELELGTQYTIDSLKRLIQKFPQIEFVWLMGADNLIQFPKWKKWEEIVKLIPIHVFDRDQLFYKAKLGKAFAKYKRKIFYHLIRKIPISSTAIRHKNKS